MEKLKKDSVLIIATLLVALGLFSNVSAQEIEDIPGPTEEDLLYIENEKNNSSLPNEDLEPTLENSIDLDAQDLENGITSDNLDTLDNTDNQGGEMVDTNKSTVSDDQYEGASKKSIPNFVFLAILIIAIPLLIIISIKLFKK